MFRPVALVVLGCALAGCGGVSNEQAKADPEPNEAGGPANGPVGTRLGTAPVGTRPRLSTNRFPQTRPFGTGPGASMPTAVAPRPKTQAIDEDPAVAAAFKAKGWTYVNDNRISDGKALVFLSLNARPLTKADAETIGKSKAVQVLDAREAKLTDADLKAVLAAPKLEAVVLGTQNLTDAGLVALAAAKNLTDVTLVLPEKITPKGYAELAKLPKLQSLDLMGGEVDDAFFTAMAGCQTLKRLSLQYVKGVTDKGAEALAKFPALENLNLGGGALSDNNLTSAGVRAIAEGNLPAEFKFDSKLIDDASLKALVAKGWLYGPSPPGKKSYKPATAADVKFFSLEGSAVTDEGFKALLPCVNLESLYISRTKLGDETMKKLAAFPKLRSLSIEKCPVTAVGLEAISALPMKEIRFGGATLTEDSFKAFAKMPELKSLIIDNAKMEAAWLTHLKGLTKLEELNLRSAVCDDAAAQELAGMPSLTQLTLNDTKLGDAGFEALLKLPKLRSLYVDNTKVTKETFLKAKREHPKMTLYYYRYAQ